MCCYEFHNNLLVVVEAGDSGIFDEVSGVVISSHYRV